MRPKVIESPIDVRIAALADAQHGSVDHDQLLDLGLHPRTIGRRLQVGRLHRLHRGVYAVGDRSLPPLGRLAAAVRALAPEGAAGRRSSAALHELRPHAGIPEVIGPPGTNKRKGIRVIQTELQLDEVCVIRGIRTTTVARTLIDLGMLGDDVAKRALKQAEFLGVFDLVEVSRLMERYPKRPGTAHLRRAISSFADSDVHTRSDMEEAFWTLVLDENLPRPEVNGTLELGEMTIEPDAMWPDAKLIVELDSRQAHATYDAFETDRERDRIAALHGWLVIRVTWRQLESQPKRLVRDIRRLLKERSMN